MSGMKEVNQIAAASIGADPATTEIIATAFGLLHVLQVYTSAMMAVAVWDWLCCLRLEWDTIWNSPWSIVKGLYIWTRYWGLIAFSICLWLFNSNFTVDECKTLHYLIVPVCMLVVLGSEAILAMRTYAFLGRKRWLGAALLVMFLGEAAFLLYVGIDAVHQTVLPVVTKGPCTASDKPGKHVVSGFWLAPVAFDLLCTFLTVYKATSLSSRGSHIVKTFVSEGIGYFLAVAAVNVLNAIFMFQSNVNIQNINCFLALILTQVLCCRLVLNLRAQGKAGAVNTSQGMLPSHDRTKPAGPVFPNTRANDTVNTVGAVSIPLERFDENTHSDERDYDYGVKVHVEVERDVEHGR